MPKRNYKKWRRRGKIELEFPKEIRDEIHRMFLDGKTYRQITMWCKKKGYDIAKSTIGRYGKEFFETYARIRRYEDQAFALTDGAPVGMPMEEALVRIVNQKLFDALMRDDFEIMEYGSIINSISSLQSSSVNRERFKIFERKVIETSEEVGEIAKKEGLSDDAANEIKKKILGLTQ